MLRRTERAQHWHRRESGQTGATQRLEQKGLGLILDEALPLYERLLEFAL